MHLFDVDGQELSASEKISGPLLPLDRIDTSGEVEVSRVPFEKLSSQRTGEPSAKVRERVEAARALQRSRFERMPLQTNADSAKPPWGMGPAEIR